MDAIKDLVKEAEHLTVGDRDRLDRIRRNSKVVIEKVFGPESHYISDVMLISFTHPSLDCTPSQDRAEFADGIKRLKTLFEAMLFDLDLSDRAAESEARESYKRRRVAEAAHRARRSSVLRFTFAIVAGIAGGAAGLAALGRSLSQTMGNLISYIPVVGGDLYAALDRPVVFGFSIGQCFVTVVLGTIGSVVAWFLTTRLKALSQADS